MQWACLLDGKADKEIRLDNGFIVQSSISMSECMSLSMSERSPKVGINQLSSMEFRGLASDCECNHRTPPQGLNESLRIWSMLIYYT
jgi:hypothetical protein